jgi:hypothetical protein
MTSFVHSFHFMLISSTSVITETFYSRLSSLVTRFLQQAKYWYSTIYWSAVVWLCCIVSYVRCRTISSASAPTSRTTVYRNHDSVCGSGQWPLLTVETTWLKIFPLVQFWIFGTAYIVIFLKSFKFKFHVFALWSRMAARDRHAKSLKHPILECIVECVCMFVRDHKFLHNEN